MGIKNGFITLNCNVLIYRRWKDLWSFTGGII
jgi:hypothetical protein